jgi:hypothetical protein
MTAQNFLNSLYLAREYFKEINEKQVPLICGGLSCTVCPLNIAKPHEKAICFQDLASLQLDKIEEIRYTAMSIFSSCNIDYTDTLEGDKE